MGFKLFVHPEGGAHWVLQARNGAVLCTSEEYDDEQAARKGINSARLNALDIRVDVQHAPKRGASE